MRGTADACACVAGCAINPARREAVPLNEYFCDEACGLRTPGGARRDEPYHKPAACCGANASGSGSGASGGGSCCVREGGCHAPCMVGCSMAIDVRSTLPGRRRLHGVACSGGRRLVAKSEDVIRHWMWDKRYKNQARACTLLFSYLPHTRAPQRKGAAESSPAGRTVLSSPPQDALSAP